MQLSKRLQAVADLVTPGNRVADVGCDHAYTSIYLARNKISLHILAMDVNQGPVDRAKENIAKYGCDDRIEVRRSDGLEKLQAGEADTIIIAGMGGGLTVQILSERPELLKDIKELILQPQSEVHKVRELLTKYHFVIIHENMLIEDGKYYVMMKAVHEQIPDHVDSYRLLHKEHFYYGRLLLEQQNSVLQEFLRWDYEICEDIMEKLKAEESESTLQRKKEIEERMELIRSALVYFQ